MKRLLRSTLRVLARLEGSLQGLSGSLRRWALQPHPALVPIPIRAERHPHGPIGRRPWQDR